MSSHFDYFQIVSYLIVFSITVSVSVWLVKRSPPEKKRLWFLGACVFSVLMMGIYCFVAITVTSLILILTNKENDQSSKETTYEKKLMGNNSMFEKLFMRWGAAKLITKGKNFGNEIADSLGVRRHVFHSAIEKGGMPMHMATLASLKENGSSIEEVTQLILPFLKDGLLILENEHNLPLITTESRTKIYGTDENK